MNDDASDVSRHLLSLSSPLSLLFLLKNIYSRTRCTREFELNQPARINSIRKKLVNSVNHNRPFPLAAFNLSPKKTGKKRSRDGETCAWTSNARSSLDLLHVAREEHFILPQHHDSPRATLNTPTSFSDLALTFCPPFREIPLSAPPNPFVVFPRSIARISPSTKLASVKQTGNICTPKSAPLFGRMNGYHIVVPPTWK